MSCSRTGKQYLLLLHKNWLLQKRKKVLTVFLVIIPILFGLILLAIRSTILSEFIPNTTTEPAFQVTTSLNYSKLRPPPPFRKWILAYSPDNAKVRSIVKETALSLNMTWDEGYGFDSEEQLEQNITAFNEVFGAIVFLNESFTNGAWAEKIKYKIRLRAEQYEGARNPNFKPNARSGWLTNLLMPTTTINGPRQENDTRGGSVPGYYEEGFLTLQQAVDESLMTNITNNASMVQSWLKKFPYPPYFKDQFVFILQTQFPFFIMLAFIVIAPSICSEVTYERELKLKESMKLMGLKGWVNWMAWFTKYFIMMLVTVIILTIIFHIKVKGASIITYTNAFVTFVFLFLYTLDIIMFCFMITTFFKKASTAAAAGTVAFLVSYIPQFFLFFQYDTMETPAKTAICLIFNLAMAQGCRTIAKFEEIGVGVQWSNIQNGPTERNTFSMGHVFIMQLVDIFIYGIITAYVDAVKPGEYGTPQPWYFPVTKNYWRNKFGLKPSYDEGTELALNEEPDFGAKSEFFQKLPADSKIGIKIRNLTKKFNKSASPAVNGISLNIKEGDITALLGHNGAGKTTTMSMLTGFIPPTSGSATINDLEIQQDMVRIRRSLGLCPQFNILFDTLTVKEHLNFFAKLKGCPSEMVDNEVDSMLKNIGLNDKTETASKALSGGMKRKLCVGIALISGSKFVILDEPSSGLDPEARRHLWTMLKQQKEGRTMILSTHYMDEADYLGDRIAIMADGRLHCCGSPMFLKNKYGVGYHMTLVKTKDCNPGKLDALIHDFIPNATMESNAGAEMSYVLPKEDSPQFSGLFRLFEEKGEEVGVASFGVSVTTIEEVFIKVKESSENEAALLAEQNLNNKDPMLANGIDSDKSQIVVTDYTHEKRRKEGVLLWFQQVQGMLIKRILNTWRNRLVSVTQILIPVIFCIIAVLVASAIPQRKDPPAIPLSLNEYKTPVTYYATSQNLPQSSNRKRCLEDVLQNYNGNKELLNSRTNSYSNDSDMDTYLVEEAKDSFYVYRNNYQVAAEVGNNYFKGFYNDESYHTIAMSLSLINNAWLRCLSSMKYSIETINHPLPWSLTSKAALDSGSSSIIGFIFADLLMFGMAFLVATFIVFLIQEKMSGAKGSQYVSGVKTGNFWFATFVWDYFNYLIPSICVIIVVLISRAEGYTHENNAGVLFLMLLMYGWGVIPSVYLLSFFFKTPSSGYVWTSIINYFTGTAASVVILILSNPSLNLVHISDTLVWVFYIIFPNFCLEKGVQNIYMNYQNTKTCSVFDKNKFCPIAKLNNLTIPCCLDNCGDFCVYSQDNYLAWGYPGIGKSLVFLFLQGIFFFSIVILFESDIFNRLKNACASNVVYVDPGSPTVSKVNMNVNTYEINGGDNHVNGGTHYGGNKIMDSTANMQQEDSDVRQERIDVSRTELSDLVSRDIVLFMRDVVKVYNGNFTAVDQLCLKVSRAECFGLLGVNGAGKTSTFKMMTGDESITRGGIYINGIDVAKQLGRTRQFVGYCPQFDALIDQLTTEENLVMHARLRGMYADNIQVASEALMKSLMLYQYKDRLAGKLSGGNKRKLGIAIALIGNPLLVFLDEPSAGMDPVARRELWNCVSAVREAGKTVILTSHSMEECEALCTRLAIMVNGQFKCLGSCQLLKSKFGSGYSVALKVGTESALENARAFMHKLYPGAYVEYEGEMLVGYRIEKDLPNASLARIFEVVEANKEVLKLEDYSVGQTSLEQVFINFAKTQREEDTRQKKGGMKRMCRGMCCCCCKDKQE